MSTPFLAGAKVDTPVGVSMERKEEKGKSGWGRTRTYIRLLNRQLPNL